MQGRCTEISASVSSPVFSILTGKEKDTGILLLQFEEVYICSMFNIFSLICACHVQNGLGDGGYIVCYEMSDIERQLGFGRNSLVIF